MTYWFDNLTYDELVTNALLLGAEFMTPKMAEQTFYGPYYRYRESHGGWSTGHSYLGTCARQYLCYLEKQKTLTKP